MDIQDKIYRFAAEIFHEADQTDQMGEAMYAFISILPTQVDCMSVNVEGVNYNYTQILEILKEQIDDLIIEKASDPDSPLIH